MAGNMVVFFAGFLVWLNIGVIFHELGHLIGGLLSGYSFSSFRLFNLIWTKEKDKIKFSSSESSLMGQCLMVPKSYEEFNYVLYNSGGGLMNLFLAFLIFIIGFFGKFSFVGIFWWSGFFAQIYLAFMNLMPIAYDIPNDGMNIYEANQCEKAKYGLYLLLMVNNELIEGKRLRELDREIFKMDKEDDKTNYFVANIYLLYASYLEDKGDKDYIKVYKEIDTNNFQNYYSLSCQMEILYYSMVFTKKHDNIEKQMGERKVKKFLQKPIAINYRVKIAYSFFIAKDIEETLGYIKELREHLDAYTNSGFVKMEEDRLSVLMDILIREAQIKNKEKLRSIWYMPE